MALDAEYQALERAATFEQDRNKVQRQFKVRCVRVTKGLLAARQVISMIPSCHNIVCGHPNRNPRWVELNFSPDSDSLIFQRCNMVFAWRRMLVNLGFTLSRHNKH